MHAVAANHVHAAAANHVHPYGSGQRHSMTCRPLRQQNVAHRVKSLDTNPSIHVAVHPAGVASMHPALRQAGLGTGQQHISLQGHAEPEAMRRHAPACNAPQRRCAAKHPPAVQHQLKNWRAHNLVWCLQHQTRLPEKHIIAHLFLRHIRVMSHLQHSPWNNPSQITAAAADMPSRGNALDDAEPPPLKRQCLDQKEDCTTPAHDTSALQVNEGRFSTSALVARQPVQASCPASTLSHWLRTFLGTSQYVCNRHVGAFLHPVSCMGGHLAITRHARS
eukprot:360136-Chlamydomonas_euryale.AAC.5